MIMREKEKGTGAGRFPTRRERRHPGGESPLTRGPQRKSGPVSCRARIRVIQAAARLS